MPLFVPCPAVVPGGSLVFQTRPGFGPHELTSALANNVVIVDVTTFSTALACPTNATEPMDIGTTIRIYNTAAGTTSVFGSPGVSVSGVTSAPTLTALVVTKTDIDVWVSAVQPYVPF